MLLVRANLRHLLGSPWQTGMALLGVTLGVAVVIAIDLSLGTAQQAFQLANRLVVGSATHQVVGGPRGLPESVYVGLRKGFRDLQPRPMITARVHSPAPQEFQFQLIGVDPLAGAVFDDQVQSVAAGMQAAAFTTLLQRSGAVFIARDTAAHLGIAIGDTLIVDTGGRIHQVLVAGLLTGAGRIPDAAIADLMVTDIASAQELLDTIGFLSRVDLAIAPSAAGRARLAAVTAVLPAGTSLLPASRQAETAREMTASFEFNLTMLSALALLVGMFLIYNCVTFSVVRRRTMFARLRALGVTGRQILRLVLIEAALLGVVAAVLGLLVGYWLSQELLQLIGGTINDLYFPLQVDAVHVSETVLLKAAVFGIGACLLAAWIPAREAMAVVPGTGLSRSTLEWHTRRNLSRNVGGAVVFLLSSGFILWLPVPRLELGFLALFCVVVGFVLLTPAAIVGLVHLTTPLGTRLAGLLAPACLRGILANLNRVSVAVCALMVALSATIGMAIMVDSFRRDVTAWLEQSLAADIYVSVSGHGTHRKLSLDLAQRIAGLHEVAGISTGRRIDVQTPRGQASLVAIQPVSARQRRLQFTDGSADEAWEAYQGEGGVFVSEPLASRWALRRGAALMVTTDRGQVEFRVAGIYRDYASDRGELRINRVQYNRYFDDPGFTTLGVYLRGDAAPPEVANRLRALIPANQQVTVRSTRELRERSLAIFDRTFLVTRVLRGIIILVAFVGVMGAIMALQLEDRRNHAVLRAQGVTQGQLRVMLYSQGGLIGLFAALLAMPLGVLIGAILVTEINRRAFGWSLDFSLAPEVLIQALVIAVLAAVTASIYPARRSLRYSLADALREG